MNETLDQRCLEHLKLVLAYNETTNLTRIDSIEKGQLLHIEDSLAGVPEIEAAPQGPYADLGSGGGFPGIPIALATGRETTLVESVQRKAQALETFVKQLHLEQSVSVYTGRAEELARERPRSFAVISARALSNLASLMELAAPLLMMQGRLVCYKAQIDENEYEQACGLEGKLGLAVASDRSYMLSDGETHRRVIVFEKVADPIVALPRRNGMAQKRPYRSEQSK